MTPENRPDRLVFGQRIERRNLQPSGENQSILEVYRLAPLIGKAIIASDEERLLQQAWRKKKNREILELIWGEGEPKLSLSPAIIAKCLRWAGYELLGYSPLSKSPREIMILSTGTSIHWKMLGALRQFGKIEYPVVIGEDKIGGYLDFRFQNPKTGEYQIADLKTTSKEGFSLINREGMPPWMVQTEKDFYVPRPEDRLQVLLYMFAERERGYKVEIGNVIYINRNFERRRLSRKNLDEDQILQDMLEWTKECPVLWDKVAEGETKQCLAEVEEAWIAIKKGELPKPSVHPKSAPYLCGDICPYRLDCEPGRAFAAREVRREAERLPREVWAIAKRQFEERREKGIKLDKVQARLPLFEGSSPRCGDCWGPTIFDEKRREFVCDDPSCPNYRK
ncbi:MAG: hypothetical protein ACOZBZ_04845 [Patescibacteria group bacterium]